MNVFAEVLSQHPLFLPATTLGPAWVRAASGLAWFGSRIGLVQDDTTAIVWLGANGAPLAVQSLETDNAPPKHFDALLGNKRLKPDLEAAVSFRFGGCEYWLALGSGSTNLRTRAVMLCATPDESRPRWLSLQGWFDDLQGCAEFAGAGLNIEGAFVRGDCLYLVQRGNGRLPGAINAIAEFALGEVCAYLNDTRLAVPKVQQIYSMVLGCIDGVPWGFADACVIGSRVWFLLSAEDSPDAIDDGAVLGSALAFCDDADFAKVEIGQIVNPNGLPVRLKLEGLCALDDGNLLAVSDDDDPHQPAQCLRLRLIPTLDARN